MVLFGRIRKVGRAYIIGMMNYENNPNYEALKHQARQTDIVEWLRQNDPELYGKLRLVGNDEYTFEHIDSIRISGYKWIRNSEIGEVY